MHAKCETKTDDLIMIADASAMIKHQPIISFCTFHTWNPSMLLLFN